MGLLFVFNALKIQPSLLTPTSFCPFSYVELTSLRTQDGNAGRAERESLVVEIDPQHDGHLPVFVHVVASEIESGSEYGLHTHDCFWLQP